MDDNYTNYSPSLITGGGKGGGSALSLLEQDLAKHNAQDVSAHPEWDEILQRLDKCFIDRDTQLIEQKHLMEIHGVKCFPRGDLVAISGKEKCGKTTACRILSTILLRGEYEGFTALEKNLRILWIDTEQARVSTRTVSRAIDMMCNFQPTSDQIRFLNLREWGDKASMRLVLQVMFNEFRPDFVILDGIRDFIEDFNDVCQSADIVLEVMRLSSGISDEEAKEKKLNARMPCSIVCILHQNKPKDDNNMRGHLGTELANKAGEVWESTRDADGLFRFTQTRSRTRPLEEAICFKVRSKEYIDATGRVEEIGIPEIWNQVKENVVVEPLSETIVTRNHGEFPKTAVNVHWMFWNYMHNQGFKWTDLCRQFCDYYGITWQQMTSYKKIIDCYIVKDEKTQLWYYQGPSFDEPTGGD